jgi:hypothetical protein
VRPGVQHGDVGCHADPLGAGSGRGNRVTRLIGRYRFCDDGHICFPCSPIAIG